MEQDQKLIRPEEVHPAFAHQVSAKSDQRFVDRCLETVQSIRGQETEGIQWSMAES